MKFQTLPTINEVQYTLSNTIRTKLMSKFLVCQTTFNKVLFGDFEVLSSDDDDINFDEIIFIEKA